MDAKQTETLQTKTERTRWLRNPKTGLRFPWTQLLADRGDLILEVE